MRVLEEARVRIAVAGTTAEAPLVRGRAALAGVEVEAEAVEPPGAPSGGPSLEVRWAVANTGAAPVALDSVALVWDAGAMGADPRLFVNGYQSWSPVGALRLGIETDPSLDPRPIPLVRAAFHADPGVVAAGTLRSEQIAVLADGGRALAAIGFTGGARHAGTIYARAVDERLELAASAWLGGARLDPGTRRELHDIVVDDTDDDPSVLLERWAARAGLEEHARVDAPFIVGWCSWYHYFDAVTEKDVIENLARAGADAWPFDVFQIDDGYQRAIGDWLQTNEKFPSEIDALAAAIAAAGRTPGIWLAPFLAAPTAELTHAHPEWLARAPNDGGFAIGGYGDAWGGVMAELDTTNPEVLDHLQATASAMVSAGFRYLKLDFTYSAAMPGRYADPTRTPAERVRAGYEAIRRGAGNDVFILGCGAPLGAVVGVVDGMRIGPDVAPWWDPPPDAAEQQPAYELTTPATRHAFLGTCARSFMHRRLWSNDPDCVMLRTTATRLAPSAADAWARTVGASGGMVLVSDDPAAVEPAGRRLLDEVVADGRAADDAARRGDSPRAVGLLDPGGPRGLSGPAVSVTLDLPGGDAATTVRAIRSRPR